MKKLFSLAMAALALLALLGASAAYAAGVNITIPDTITSGSPDTWYNRSTYPGEDQEVEPGCVQDQKWDLEAFVIKNNNLYIIGGFDFKNGVEGWKIGGLFIANTEMPSYGAAAANLSPPGTGVGVISNIFGYDFVLTGWTWDQNDPTKGAVKLYNLTGQSTLKVWFDQNKHANPYDLNNPTNPVDSVAFTYMPGLSNDAISEYGVSLQGGSHNVICLSLADLPLSTDNWLHLTEQCGNDNLMGYARVPIPPSVLLLGSGLLGLGLVGRWRKKG